MCVEYVVFVWCFGEFEDYLVVGSDFEYFGFVWIYKLFD